MFSKHELVKNNKKILPRLSFIGGFSLPKSYILQLEKKFDIVVNDDDDFVQNFQDFFKIQFETSDVVALDVFSTYYNKFCLLDASDFSEARAKTIIMTSSMQNSILLDDNDVESLNGITLIRPKSNVNRYLPFIEAEHLSGLFLHLLNPVETVDSKNRADAEPNWLRRDKDILYKSRVSVVVDDERSCFKETLARLPDSFDCVANFLSIDDVRYDNGTCLQKSFSGSKIFAITDFEINLQPLFELDVFPEYLIILSKFKGCNFSLLREKILNNEIKGLILDKSSLAGLFGDDEFLKPVRNLPNVLVVDKLADIFRRCLPLSYVDVFDALVELDVDQL